MSKTRDGQATPSHAQKGLETAGKPGTDLPPLKPRPGLVILFGILLVLLFAGMLTMYFTTVYPNRNKPHSTETDQAAAPPATQN